MLLYWCTLESAGPSKLAAVRFTSPVRVQSMRIFPTGSLPFRQDLDVAARTEPGAFLLDVFFNAHPVSPDAKSKQRAANVLVPTTIAYTGGQVDFSVNMASDSATRLIILKGNFESISIAIYGELITERAASASAYEPRLLPSTDSSVLSRSLDPSNSAEPTLLAQKLLSLIPDSPSLALVIRLMFCLKPIHDDWERPEFPYLYADLSLEDKHFTLENACSWTSTPVDDNVAPEYLEKFASKVAEAVVPKDNAHSYLIAGILRNVSPQHPDFATYLMKHLDLPSIFETSNLDESTLLRILASASNISVAQGLNNDWFLGLLRAIIQRPGVDREVEFAARRLLARITGWGTLEDALSNTQANFAQAAAMLRDTAVEEYSFGALLETMLYHRGVAMALAENPVLPKPQVPPFLFDESPNSVSHDEFISFLRAYLGISCVLAVYAWADSLPHEECRERALGILRLWQKVDGYREIVNKLLLLPQMSFRLKSMTTSNDPPTQSGMHAEHIILNLAMEPCAFLSEGFVECILYLQQPLLFITHQERLNMRKLALIADEGLDGAFEILKHPPEHPMDGTVLRILRLSMAIIAKELEGGDLSLWRVVETFWKHKCGALCEQLVDLLTGIKDELKPNFGLAPPPSMAQGLVQQLFSLADDILHSILKLASASPLTGRSTRALIIAVADIFVCTDAADMSYSSGHVVCAAHATRRTCIDLVCAFSTPQRDLEYGNPVSCTVLKALLEHGYQYESNDPVANLLRVLCLVDHVLPHSPTEGERIHWVTMVLPRISTELSSFFRNLDNENKLHLLKRLVNLDHGVSGIGEWLVLEEFHDLSRVLQILDDPTIEDHHRLLGRHQILLSLRFVVDLLSSTPSVSEWFLGALGRVSDLSEKLAACFTYFVDTQLSSPCLGQIARTIAEKCETINSELRFTIAIALYRSVREHENLYISLHLALSMLKDLPSDAIDTDRLRKEFGAALFAASETPLTEEFAEAILSTVVWWSEQENTSVAVSKTALEQLCSNLSEILDSSEVEKLNAAVLKIHPTSVKPPPISVELPTDISLSLDDISDVLRPPIAIPSTPTNGAKDELFNMVAISPPTAFLRSPAVTGLTKTYLNNDFRQLRSMPNARQNTSRLPSTHVDDFESGPSSPMLVPLSSPELYHAISMSPTFPHSNFDLESM